MGQYLQHIGAIEDKELLTVTIVSPRGKVIAENQAATSADGSAWAAEKLAELTRWGWIPDLLEGTRAALTNWGLDPDDFEIVEVNAAGGCWVRGPVVAMQYLAKEGRVHSCAAKLPPASP